MSGMPKDRSNIKAVLKLFKDLLAEIDHDDIVILTGKTLKQATANLTGPKDDNFHGSTRID